MRRKGTPVSSELLAMRGRDLGQSDWFLIDQERVDQFADVTLDHQFIHVDPAAAGATPLGGTIVHGFLTLSLLVHLLEDMVPRPQSLLMGFNYGFDRIRFLAPVPVGSRVRATMRVVDVVERQPQQFLTTYDVSVEIEGTDKPALVATWLNLLVLGDDQ